MGNDAAFAAPLGEMPRLAHDTIRTRPKSQALSGPVQEARETDSVFVVEGQPDLSPRIETDEGEGVHRR